MSETLPSGGEQPAETFPQPQEAPEAYDKLLGAIMDVTAEEKDE